MCLTASHLAKYIGEEAACVTYCCAELRTYLSPTLHNNYERRTRISTMCLGDKTYCLLHMNIRHNDIFIHKGFGETKFGIVFVIFFFLVSVWPPAEMVAKNTYCTVLQLQSHTSFHRLHKYNIKVWDFHIMELTIPPIKCEIKKWLSSNIATQSPSIL